MTLHLNRGLSFADWPAADRDLWDRLSVGNDLFDDGPASEWSNATRQNLQYAYALWLGTLALVDPPSLDLAPADRVTRQAVEEYVECLRANCRDTTVFHCVARLFYVLRAICPEQGWDWIYRLSRRIAAEAEPIRHPQVLSSDLYRIGLRLMDRAEATTIGYGRLTKSSAIRYRDGMLIAVLVEAPMRRRPFSQLRLGEHVLKRQDRWTLHVPASLSKTGVAQDYDLSDRLCRYMDVYLQQIRPAFPGADTHDFLWPYEERPMGDKMIRRRIIKRTTEALGFPVSPHRFRNAAATFVSIADPDNIRMTKDLLGHTSFAMTETHYIDGAQSRIAGRELARLLDNKGSQRREFDPLLQSPEHGAAAEP
jgi:integrase